VQPRSASKLERPTYLSGHNLGRDWLRVGRGQSWKHHRVQTRRGRLFWLIYLWHRRHPHRNAEQRLHFCGMEWRRLQRHCHLFGHSHCQHVGNCDVHAEYASAGRYLGRDALTAHAR
jgi:hypothetical protein